MLQIAPELFDEVLSAYDLGKGTITHTPYGEGHINNTNLVTVTGKDTHRYILQRINTDIFTDPSALMGKQVLSAAQPLIAKLTILSPERQCPAFLCLCPLCCRCGILLSTAANKCDRQNCRCHKRIACSFHVQLFPLCQNLMYKIFF